MGRRCGVAILSRLRRAELARGGCEAPLASPRACALGKMHTSGTKHPLHRRLPVSPTYSKVLTCIEVASATNRICSYFSYSRIHILMTLIYGRREQVRYIPNLFEPLLFLPYVANNDMNQDVENAQSVFQLGST